MNGIGAIKAALESTRHILKMYVDDFTDADLFVRPVPAANHAAWQLGQIITGDVYLVRSALPDAAFPELPPGSFELYGKEGAKKDGPDGFLTKAEYLALFDAVRSATIAALETFTDADLDRPTTGDMAAFAPTLGHLFLAASNHTLMHAGQFTVIRRKLGKPVLF
jgi:hypothetical protein